MKWFFIGYELRDDQRDYSGLWDELEELKARRVLPSVWFVRAKYSINAAALSESIARHLGSEDRLLIIESCDSKWKNSINNPLGQHSSPSKALSLNR
jgi:hypothetical protein